MSRQQNKFTVIVPTRERADTLIHCLRTLLAQEYENLTVLVSDNLSQDSTRDVVASFSDRRLVYVNTGRRIGMSRNWEFALSHVKQGWVTFLGDDDGLVPGGLSILDEAIQEYPCDAVNAGCCVYFWPSDEVPGRAKLAVPTRTGSRYEDSSARLASVMVGGTRYNELPWLYHGGFAKIELINRARNESGQFFLSPNPDIYSAVALASITKEYLCLSDPVAIAGASRHSIGSSNTSISKNTQAWGQFLAEDNVPFLQGMVLGKSNHIFLLECFLKSRFLRKDAGSLNLHDQLQIAYADAGPGLEEVVASECETMANLNGIRFSRRSFGCVTRVFQQRLSRQFRRVTNVPGRRVLQGEKEAGRTIYEASLKAAQVLAESRQRDPYRTALQNTLEEAIRRIRWPRR